MNRNSLYIFKLSAGSAVRIIVFNLLAVLFLCSMAAAPAGANNDSANPLTIGMQLMNQKKFDEARQILKTALQSDPYNELLWTAFESCIRSDAYSSIGNLKDVKDSGAKNLEPATNENLLNSAKIDIDENDTLAVVFKNLQDITAKGGTETKNIEGDANLSKGYENQGNITLESDFSTGVVKGELGCILTESFKFIKIDSVSFLALKNGVISSTMTFSFSIKTFPRKILLSLSHRVFKRDKYKSSAKFIVCVNDNKINYDDVKLGNTVENIEFDITNFCKNGGNMISVTVDKSAAPYLLKNIRLTQLNKL